jgi:glycerol-3-phosphate cytidylyltransferase
MNGVQINCKMPRLHCKNKLFLQTHNFLPPLFNHTRRRAVDCRMGAFFVIMRTYRKILGKIMRKVITYGTFDLFHYGHVSLLRRAKALGDYLVVALSTDEFNFREKNKRAYFSYEERKAVLESIKFVDEVIPEEAWEQKLSDVKKHGIAVFTIGDDWAGKFDFLREEGCEVVYLERTPEVSSSAIKRDCGAGG